MDIFYVAFFVHDLHLLSCNIRGILSVLAIFLWGISLIFYHIFLNKVPLSMISPRQSNLKEGKDVILAPLETGLALPDKKSGVQTTNYPDVT